MAEFSGSDWTIFKVFAILEMINLPVMFCFANKAGHMANELTVIRERMSEAAIRSAKLPPGNVYKVFVPEDITERVTVMKIPGSDKVYYVRETVLPGGRIYTEDDSPIYDSYEDLLPELDNYFEIQLDGKEH